MNTDNKMNDTPETDADCWDTLAGAMRCSPSVPHAYVTAVTARKLERERDEAKELAADWKLELDIATARLKGEKHQRDNGIMADGEADVAALSKERDEARQDLEFRRDLFALQEKQLNKVRAERDEVGEKLERAASIITQLVRLVPSGTRLAGVPYSICSQAKRFLKEMKRAI